MNTCLRWICGAASALALAACSQSASVSDDADTSSSSSKNAGPALWKASDEDTTVYLFGTVHVLPPELKWRTPVFDEAFYASKTIYFEASLDENDPALAALITKLGTMPLGQSLFDLLSEEDKQLLIAAADEVGVPSASLSRFRPWFAGLVLAMQHIVAQGQDPESGVESVLEPEAKADGKVMRYFETAEQQLRFMADLDDETQVQFLMDGVRQIKDIPDLIEQMDTAWVEGDVEGLADIILEDQSIKAPEVYDVMLSGRNRRWTNELFGVINEEEGIFFVAVGAAHLAGEDSVVKMLKGKGVKVERVQ